MLDAPLLHPSLPPTPSCPAPSPTPGPTPTPSYPVPPPPLSMHKCPCVKHALARDAVTVTGEEAMAQRALPRACRACRQQRPANRGRLDALDRLVWRQ
eukprot:2898403-Pyramimonas_sp.AAC.1